MLDATGLYELIIANGYPGYSSDKKEIKSLLLDADFLKGCIFFGLFGLFLVLPTENEAKKRGAYAPPFIISN